MTLYTNSYKRLEKLFNECMKIKDSRGIEIDNNYFSRKKNKNHKEEAYIILYQKKTYEFIFLSSYKASQFISLNISNS